MDGMMGDLDTAGVVLGDAGGDAADWAGGAVGDAGEWMGGAGEDIGEFAGEAFDDMGDLGGGAMGWVLLCAHSAVASSCSPSGRGEDSGSSAGTVRYWWAWGSSSRASSARSAETSPSPCTYERCCWYACWPAALSSQPEHQAPSAPSAPRAPRDRKSVV